MADGAERESIVIETRESVGELAPGDWDACAAPEAADGGHPRDPFATHRLLSALERSGSVGGRTGWTPRPLLARAGDGRLLGVAPLYLKSHSQGEYVFDHAWAHAWERAGGDYYPKLQCAIPFTPATGRRWLTRPGPEAEIAADALLQGAVELAARNRLSSLHVTFCTEAEWRRGGELGLLQRQDQQFHWENRGYGAFDDFLADLASRKRKQLRKERETAVAGGVEIVRLTGDAIEPEHWEAFWRFYQDTGARKWGRPYLTRAFFEEAQTHLRDDVLLVMCRRAGRWIAGALNFIGRETLFGRYWGCVEEHPCLHFETCYYQAIEAAIELGLARVEAGAQGAHKLARGYLPSPTYSLHWIGDRGFRAAVADYLRREREAVSEEIEFLLERGPFRKEG
ncbi:MAG: GNAT family N-acetyltransferase [Rubrimonas sp.]|uniref:GNAT family N-acetyltransferase n=1 Tax=Rubrimonas sp. TaxID=2036015 RepID=UPI002FDCF239